MRRFGITVACTLNARGSQKQGSDGRPCSHNDVRRYAQVPYVNLCLASKHTALSDPAQTSPRFQTRPCGLEEHSKVTNCIQAWNCTLCTPSSLLLVGFHMLIIIFQQLRVRVVSDMALPPAEIRPTQRYGPHVHLMS